MAWPLHITSIEHNGLYTSESYILHMGCGCASACFLYSYYVYFLCRASSSQDIHSMALCASFDFHPFFITHSIVATFPFSLACVCHPCIHQMDTRTQEHTHTHYHMNNYLSCWMDGHIMVKCAVLSRIRRFLLRNTRWGWALRKPFKCAKGKWFTFSFEMNRHRTEWRERARMKLCVNLCAFEMTLLTAKWEEHEEEEEWREKQVAIITRARNANQSRHKRRWMSKVWKERVSIQCV